MAIFHFSLQNISAGKGRSAIAAASYRSGEELYSERLDQTFKYEKNQDAKTFILKPDNAPEWCLNRERLWNEVEKIEKGKNARYAKEINLALPVELENEEQERLLIEYCQSTFADSGMVADIAIHRLDEGNPHAHIMLTNRPFNNNGEWGKKWNIEYILDSYGNKTFTENGNVKKRTTPTVDWDSKDTLVRWRTSWADTVNLSLERNGYSARISAASLEADGIDRLPTVHEGKSHGSKARKEYNQGIRDFETTKQKYGEAKEKFETYKRFDLLTKNMTPDERMRISKLSESLRTFINFQNVEDKKRMINNWSNSTYIKEQFGEDATAAFAKIESQDRYIAEADNILLKMSSRLLEKKYSFLPLEKMTEYEIKWLADKTIKEGVLSERDVKAELNEIRPHLLEKQVLLVTKQPYQSWMILQKQRIQTGQRLGDILAKYDRTISTIGDTGGKDIPEFYGEDYKKIRYMYTDLARYASLEKVITAHYDDALSKVFPEADLLNIKIEDKENIYNLVLYHNPDHREITIDELLNLADQPKFSTEERQAGIKAIGEGNSDGLEDYTELKRVLSNKALTRLFMLECAEDSNITLEQLHKAKEQIYKEDAEEKQYMDRHDIYPTPTHEPDIRFQIRSILNSLSFLFKPDDSDIERKIRIRKLRELEQSLQRKSKGRGL